MKINELNREAEMPCRRQTSRKLMSSIRLAAFLLVAGGATCPQLAQAGDNTVLLLADSDTAFRPVPVPSPYETALKELGMTYQFFSNAIAFAQAVSSADPSNTVLILDVIDYAHNFSSVVNFVNSGGRAILQYWGLGNDYSLAAAFGVSVAETFVWPLSVYDWGSPLFSGLTNRLGCINLFNVDGQKLNPTAGGQAEAGFVSAPAVNEAAIVVGNQGRTVVNGFGLEEIACGRDAVRLAQNEILYLTYTASATAPIIAAQPQSRMVVHGAAVDFHVVAWGAQPLSFQWHKDGAEIVGATYDTYRISAVQSSDEGAYSVVVSNIHDTVASAAASLMLTSLAPVQSVLLFLDLEGIGIPSRYETALMNMGLAYQVFTNDYAFELAVANADPFSTLLILDIVNFPHNLTRTADLVDIGGRAILQHWDLIENPCLAAAFDVSVVQNLNSPPPVYDWGGSPLFAGLTSPVQFADLFGVDGQRLQPNAGGLAQAGFVSTPTANQAALVAGNENRTLVNGFALEEITAAAQAVQLAQNEIEFLINLPLPVELLSPAWDGGEFQVVLNGPAGLACCLQASTNLVHWASVTNLTLSGSPTLVTVSALAPRGFFRVVSPSVP